MWKPVRVLFYIIIMKKEIISVIALLLFVYLLFAFTKADINFVNWGGLIRGLYAFISACIVILYLWYVFIKED